MKLSEAMKIGAWSPLRSVAGDLSEVFPNVFQIQHDLFLHTQPYNQAHERGLPEAPFVTLLYWASSLQALQRHLQSDAAVDIPIEKSLPVDLARGSDGSYDRLKEMLSAMCGSCIETATYNMSGEFIYKHLSGCGLEFHFTSPAINPEQRPCLATVRLGRLKLNG